MRGSRIFHVDFECVELRKILLEVKKPSLVPSNQGVVDFDLS